MDGFERLILNGFKTEDIFLSHGCNKNNKNVECKNKSFREEKVQLVKQLKWYWMNLKRAFILKTIK